MSGAEGKFLQIYILAMRIDPLKQKFHADSKNGLKKSHTILERPKFWGLDFVVNDHPNF